MVLVDFYDKINVEVVLVSKSINITIYCDEIKNMSLKDKISNVVENWDYIGILIVPSENIKELAYELNSKRCPNNNYNTCKENCRFHVKNKVKVHYQDYSDTNNYQIADRWCDIIKNNTIYNKRFYTHVLGINTVKIDKIYFKSNDEMTNVENNIYNRFFRTAIIYPIKSFFSEYDEVIIDNIYHDCGNMDHYKYFKKQPLRKINEEIKKVKLNFTEITTILTDNDNCLDEHNAMLQLIDLYLGAVMNCLHHAGKKYKEEIALKLYPVVERCINNPGNKNSKYYKINSIIFYPKHKIDKDDDWIDIMIKRQDNFYTNRELKIIFKNQMNIFELIN